MRFFLFVTISSHLVAGLEEPERRAKTSAATRWGGGEEPTSGPVAPWRVRKGGVDEDFFGTVELIWTSVYQIKACIIS